VHASKGWVGFFSATAAPVTHRLATSVPNVVSWDNGIRVSPIFRALKQLTPVIVVLADSRTTQIFRYREGDIEELETLDVETVVGPIYHMGDAPRAGFHAGVRGTTGTDEAERITRAATARMYRALEERLQKLARDSWIVVGGTLEACTDIDHNLAPEMKERSVIISSLHMRSRASELIDAARSGASELRDKKGRAVVELLAELAGAGGRGSVGVKATLAALSSGAVQTLYFTMHLMESNPDVAESLVRHALHQGAEIELLNGAAAKRLDDEFRGVAARLRFVQAEQAVS
jgi:hypothetical protein